MTSNACFEGIPARLLGTHKVDSGEESTLKGGWVKQYKYTKVVRVRGSRETRTF